MLDRIYLWLSRALLVIGFGGACFVVWLIRTAFAAPETLAAAGRAELVATGAVWLAASVPVIVTAGVILRVLQIAQRLKVR